MLYIQIVGFDQYKMFRSEGVYHRGDGKKELIPVSTDFSLENQDYWCLLRLVNHGDDTIVGTLSFRRQDDLLKIRDVEILGSYRNNGLGTKFLMILIEMSRIQGIQVIQLVVFNHRTVAQHIYEKLGFQTIKTFEKSCKMKLSLPN